MTGDRLSTVARQALANVAEVRGDGAETLARTTLRGLERTTRAARDAVLDLRPDRLPRVVTRTLAWPLSVTLEALISVDVVLNSARHTRIFQGVKTTTRG